MLRTPALGLAALVLLTATACGDDDSSSDGSAAKETPAAEGQAKAADGEEISGTGYTYRVPEGWGVPKQPTPGFDPDSFAADLTDDDGFADNINVVLSPAGEITPEQIEDAGAQELETAGASDVSVEDRVTVAGGESAHLRGDMSVGTRGYAIDQFYVSTTGKTFVVTFSFSPDIATEDRDAVTESTLASWTWTD